jgi:hypothetical protein
MTVIEPSGALVETIVRFHDLTRLDELCPALLCLIGQTYRPLRVMLVTQRFGAEPLRVLQTRLEIYRRIDPTVTLDVINYTETGNLQDARSALINAGIGAARGRYLALLDYDDTLYPQAYALLVEELQASGCAVAYAGVSLKSVTVDPALPHGLAFARMPQPNGSGLLDMFRESFCPLHSLLLDRSLIDPADLRTDETLPIFEDYEWQLRLATRYLLSFARLAEVIGDYRLRDDGSNTVPLANSVTPQRRAQWNHYAEEIERRRRNLVIEVAVQATIGLSPPLPGLTIRALLDGLDNGSLVVRPPRYLEPRVLLNSP